MGAFLTNVQVRSDRSAADAAAVLRVHFESRGMRVAEEGEVPDRGILVLAREGWISIYDEESEGQNDAVLSDVARAVSQGLDALAFSVCVHDSDVLFLTLFDRGDKADEFDSNPSFSGKRPRKPKFDRWTPFLAKGHTKDELRAVWTKEHLFAEDTLAETVALFGLGRERASIGWNYADKNDAQYTHIALRRIERPAAEAKAEGLSRFAIHGYNDRVEASQAMEFRLGISARNEGGASRGLSVVAAGEAVINGLFDARKAEIVLGVPRDAVRIEKPFERRGDAFVATFEDAEIPPGLAGGLSALAGLPAQKMVDAMYSACVHVNIAAVGAKSGTANLVLGIVPHADEQGAVFHESTLDVQPTPRRPLRAKPDVDAHTLRGIDEGGWLFAQVSLDCDRKTASELVAPIFESWASQLEGQLQIGVHRSDRTARPRVGQVKAERFFAGEDWKRVKGEFATERSVEVRSDSAGFFFGTHLIPHDVADPELPSFAIWTKDERAREALERAVDSLGDRVVQALLTQWTSPWPPLLDSTSYELACDIHGQCTLYKSWLTRWLRGVGKGVLWIGNDLAAHIGKKGMQRIVVSDIDEVERALSAILPSHDDWHRGVNRLYGR